MGTKEPQTFTHSPDIWYADGSVILVASSGQTVPQIAFRVHKTILASHCDVFRDMFDIPQPAHPNDSDDGDLSLCPIVHLQDSPTDLTYFLKSIYIHSFFTRKRTKFEIVAGVLRLSTKYAATDLRQCACELLLTTFPTTLGAWNMRKSRRLVPPFEREYVAYIALALQTDFHAILPAVYYEACSRPLSELLSDFQKLHTAGNIYWDIHTAFFLGREKVDLLESKNILAFLDPSFPRPRCANGADKDSLSRIASVTAQKTSDIVSYARWCSTHTKEVGQSLGLCQPCCDNVAICIEEGQGKVWEGLPACFGMSDWDILEARDGVQIEDSLPVVSTTL